MAIGSGVLLPGVAENTTFPILSVLAYTTGLGGSPTCDGSDRATWGVSAHAWNITVCDFPFFHFFFIPSPRLQVATVDRFSRSIRQTTRFRARKCLLGSRWWILTFTPLFSPKFENLHYGLWQLRTAITRPFLKIEASCLHQSGGFRGRAI